MQNIFNNIRKKVIKYLRISGGFCTFVVVKERGEMIRKKPWTTSHDVRTRAIKKNHGKFKKKR